MPFTWNDAAHVALNLAIATVVVAATAAVCAGTAGVGCVFAAGAAFGLLFGVVPHIALDKVTGHRTTGADAVGYVAGAAVQNGALAVGKRVVTGTVRGAVMHGSRGVKPNLSAAASNLGGSMKVYPKAVLRALYVKHGRPTNRGMR